MKDDKLKKQLDEAETKIKALEDQLAEEQNAKLLALADFQNYKKRLENEKNDYRIFATKLIMGQLMQVIDDFTRAQNDVTEKLTGNEHQEEVKNSLKMISDKIELMVTQNGFEEIEIKVGDRLDPVTMEAITSVPLSAEEKDKDGTIVHIDQKGFRHIESGLVFKTAKVIVAKFNQ
jgi:molecular chaperone GrpE